MTRKDAAVASALIRNVRLLDGSGPVEGHWDVEIQGAGCATSRHTGKRIHRGRCLFIHGSCPGGNGMPAQPLVERDTLL